MEPAFKGETHMVGCLVLTGLAVIAGMKIYRWRRWGGGWHRHHWRHHGHGFGHPGFHADGDGYGPDFMGPAPGRRSVTFAARFLSDRLEATPAQERVIGQALEDLRAEVEPLREEGRKTRADVAAALRKPSLDEVLFGELFARHDEAMDKTRKAFMGAVGKIHDALDEGQRERLAQLVERGPRFFGFGRPW
jgi:uncharacterized membrane protein